MIDQQLQAPLALILVHLEPVDEMHGADRRLEVNEYQSERRLQLLVDHLLPAAQ